ncbi:HipA family kinase [Janthinobacterium sp. HLS12-2]|uniref:HipA family kinase n=1 Tax=Janthinobacterium sp. HLS12-2 TaxID=1259324 RepID=UPI003F296DB2
MSVQIVEIIGRSADGMTKPFICRGDDGHIYFVKGRGAARRSLICEWIAGSLGQSLGLPIAPFIIVDVPESLIQLGSRDDLRDLGAGPAFGSRKVAAVEITISHLDQIPITLQCDVLAFDWWIRNADRMLSKEGGNPNLLWGIESKSLVVIDHNQAFDLDFSIENFTDMHVFHDQINTLCGDWLTRENYCTRFADVVANWDFICNTIPLEWWFVDPEQTILVDFDRAAVRQQLLECQNDTFWKMI